MKLNLGSPDRSKNFLINSLDLSDQNGNRVFSIIYDKGTNIVQFSYTSKDDTTEKLVATKSMLTLEKGVEAYGSFISGAVEYVPTYKHLLTIYIPEGTTFNKYHVTIDTFLESMALENLFLLSIETYSLLYPIIKQIEVGNIGDLADNLDSIQIIPYFSRSYDFPFLSNLLNSIPETIDQEEFKSVFNAHGSLVESMTEFKDTLIASKVYFTTVSGALLAQKNLLEKPTHVDLDSITIQNLCHASLTSPGMYLQKRAGTIWFPFNRTRIGRIGRILDTILNAFQYAGGSRVKQDQTQNNTAYKFHDLLRIVSAELKDSNLELETNLGYIAFSFMVSEDFDNDVTEVIKIASKLAPLVRNFGVQILAYLAKNKKFATIPFVQSINKSEENLA